MLEIPQCGKLPLALFLSRHVSDSVTYTIVGVIGHIDHGKTSLVAALTNIDTDTHPEEKRRGITIDLGFASFAHQGHQFAMIDAPGHQRYIGNLLAGVARVDIGLLVVASDQGIQAQTLEHAAILQSLGVRSLIVAMSRIDLVSLATRVELAEELEVFLADFGFTQIPIVPLSSVTGEGLDQLKSLLVSFSRRDEPRVPSYFRLPIDRVITVPGRGCVVAGTIWAGSVRVGNQLSIARTGKIVRVRELESHGESVEASTVGRRTAINLAGVAVGELRRGDELIASGTYRCTRSLLIGLQMFRETQPLRCPAVVQMHCGTSSCEARITGIQQLEPGGCAALIVQTDTSVVVTHGQSCLFRKPYPVGSFAGGRVITSLAGEVGPQRRLLALAQRLQCNESLERLAAWVEYQGEYRVDPVWLELQLGLTPKETETLIRRGVEQGCFLSVQDGLLVADHVMERMKTRILTTLNDRAAAADDAWLVAESLLDKTRTVGAVETASYALDALIDRKQVVKFNNMIAIASDETTLSKKQRADMARLLAVYAGNRQPPTVKEVAASLELTPDAIQSLIRFASQQSVLTDLGEGFVISTEVFAELCAELQEMFVEQVDKTVAEIKESWQVTRKHAIPLLEYCDRVGITQRSGANRCAGPLLRSRAIAAKDPTD